MAKAKTDHEINLLPQEEFEASTLGRVLKWLLSTFRYIVIGTEMVVMGAFLSRFWLDARSSELTDAVNQKQAVVASYQVLEKKYRDVQAKLKIFSNYTSSTGATSSIISLIANTIPTDVTLDNISINGAKLDLTAVTQNENSASQFVTNLTSSKLLSNVNLTSVDTKTGSTEISFIVTGTIAKEGQ